MGTCRPNHPWEETKEGRKPAFALETAIDSTSCQLATVVADYHLAYSLAVGPSRPLLDGHAVRSNSRRGSSPEE